MKSKRQLEAFEVVIIATIVRYPETFRQVRDILRPDMFETETGQVIAGAVWPLIAGGKFSGALLHGAIGDDLIAVVNNAAKTAADPENVRQAAELMAADWADKKYKSVISDAALNYNAFEGWREADDKLNEVKREILHMSAGRVATPQEVIDGVMEEMWAGLLGKKLYSGLPTGFPDLDDLTGGWQSGQQIVVGGRPGMGKTRFAIQQAYTAAKSGAGVVYYSLEIGKEMIYKYLLSYMTGVSVGAMKTYNLHKEEADQLSEAAKILKGMPLYIVDDVFSVEDAIYSAREIAEQHGVKLIVVDYLQLIGKTNGKRNENRNNELSEISRAFKQLARQTNAATLILSQISRKATDRPGQIPTMSDLRDSGAIEADADVIIFPYKPKDITLENPARLIVEKQRDGETGIIEADWKNPGFYYPVPLSEVKPFDMSMNGKMKPAEVNDFQDIPF